MPPAGSASVSTQTRTRRTQPRRVVIFAPDARAARCGGRPPSSNSRRGTHGRGSSKGPVKPTADWSTLPGDVMLLIVEKGPEFMARQLHQVCWSWRTKVLESVENLRLKDFMPGEAALVFPKLRRLSFADLGVKIYEEDMAQLQPLNNTLMALDISGNQVSTAVLEILGQTFSNLIELSLHRCLGVCNDGLHKLMALRKLKMLNIGGLKITDEGLIPLIREVTAITSLEMMDTRNITDRAIQCMATSLAQLSNLDISWNTKLVGHGLFEFTLHTALHSLNIKATSFKVSIGRILSNMSSLRQLKMDWDRTTEKAIFLDNPLDRFSAIEELEVEGVIDDEFASKLGLESFVKFLMCFVALRKMKLVGFNVKREIFWTLAEQEALFGLQKLELSFKQSQLKSEDLAIIGFHFRSLKILCLERCPRLKCRDVRCIIGLLSNLQYLSLSQSVNVDDDTLCAVVHTLRSQELETLELLDDINITDQGISYIANIPSLKYIRITNNTKITNAALLSLCKLKNLVKVDVSGCKRITMFGIKQMVTRLRKLKSLKYTSCARSNCSNAAA